MGNGTSGGEDATNSTFARALRTSLLGFFFTAVLGGMVSGFLTHYVWHEEHVQARHEAWCDLTKAFEDSLVLGYGSEIFWGEDLIYARLEQDKDSVISSRWQRYKEAQARNRIQGSLLRARAAILYGAETVRLLDSVFKALDGLEEDVKVHRNFPLASLPVDVMRSDSIHVHADPAGWPAEFASDELAQRMVAIRRNYCVEDAPSGASVKGKWGSSHPAATRTQPSGTALSTTASDVVIDA